MRIKKLICCLFIIVVSTKAVAFDINASGYYRARGDLFKNLHLGTNELNDYRVLWNQRFRLNSEFTVSDYVSIDSTFDLLDNEFFGANPTTGTLAGNPSFYQSSASGASAAPEIAEDPSVDILALSGSQKTGSLILVKRLWINILTPIGILKIGRQPSHFGLGMTENGGDGYDSNFGDVADRISFETGYQGYVLAFGGDKDAEFDEEFQLTNQSSGVDTNADDVTRFFIKAGIDDDREKFLTMISRRWQSITDTTEWIFDVYPSFNYLWYTFEGEFTTFQGDSQSQDLSAFNWVARNTARLSLFRFGVEAGFSSGTESGPSNTTSINTISFDRDYNVGYLLFEEALPGGPGFDSFNTANTNAASAPEAVGAVSNAIYYRAFAGVTLGDIFHIDLNVINAYALKNPAIGYDPNNAGTLLFTSQKNYGVEYNFDFGLDVRKELNLGLTFAHFIPGGIFDSQAKSVFNQEGASQAITLQGRVLVRF